MNAELESLVEQEESKNGEDIKDETVLEQTVKETQRQRLIVEDKGPNAQLMDTARFEQTWRVAQAMASGSLLPDSICMVGQKGNKRRLPQHVVIGNCFRVVNQAFRWGVDPFGILDHVFVVAGKLGIDGQLACAIVNKLGGLKTNLDFRFEGDGPELTCTVVGTFDGEKEAREASLTLKFAMSRSDQKSGGAKWADPEQGLIYSTVVKWARRHCPEVLLGIVTEFDEQQRETTEVSSLDDLAAANNFESSNGIDDVEAKRREADEFLTRAEEGLGECETLSAVADMKCALLDECPEIVREHVDRLADERRQELRSLYDDKEDSSLFK